MRPRVEVAAAVLQRPDGRFLLAQRPANKVYAGYWEFPGGKIEAGESAADALVRELHEELAIDVTQAYPWITRDYDYEHAAVRLRFYRVTAWTGELHGRENQKFEWQHIAQLTVAPLLPANAPILRALALPSMYGISNAGPTGAEPFLDRLEAALDAGLRLVQIREKSLEDGELVAFTNRAVALAHARGAKVLVNAAAVVVRRTRADGVHLSGHRLFQTSVRPDFELVGASCHDERDLARAARVGVDFVVLGPVLATATHPGAHSLGWRRFAALVHGYRLPVYALGGLRQEHLERAWTAGAHGIAAIRGAWSESR